MSRHPFPIVLGLLAAAAAGRAADPPGQVPIRVVNPDSTPAAGVRVWAYAYPQDGDPPTPEPTPLVTGADGRVTITGPVGTDLRPGMLFARDATGRVSGGYLDRRFDPSRDEADPTLRLVDVADRAGRVTDPAGKPVAGAVVTPRACRLPDRVWQNQGSSDRRPRSVGFPPWEMAGRAAAKTDADGRFTLKGMPDGYDLYFKVVADGFGETWFDANGRGELTVTLARPGTVTFTVTGIDAAALKDVSWSIRPPGADGSGQTEKSRTSPRRYADGRFDGSLTAAATSVVPGRYAIEIHSPVSVPGTLGATAPFDVRPGESTSVALEFVPAAKVSGRVVDSVTRKGVPGVKLGVLHRTSPGASRYLGVVTTGPGGSYAGYGPAGTFQMNVQAVPDGYVAPQHGSRPGDIPGPAKVDVGKAYAFPDLVLPQAVTFACRAVLPDGKPAAGATVEPPDPLAFFPRPKDGRTTADADGRFVLKGLAAGDVIALRVRLGKAVNVPAIVDLTTHGDDPETVRVSEANAAGIEGRVVDPKGTSVAGAKVVLQHNVQGVGRQSSMSTYRVHSTVTTGADGRFRFDGLWPNDTYNVRVSIAGFNQAEARYLGTRSGEVRTVPPLTITRYVGVSGTVVGLDGRPVGAATVFTVDGPGRAETRSAADGRFTLAGFYDAPGWVFAEADGYRLAAVPVTPGAGATVTVTVRRKTDPPAPAPVVSPDHVAKQQHLLRHILQKMWDTRDDFGLGGTAVREMAKFDPAAARKWAGGNPNLVRLVNAAEREKTLLETARQDIDEAVASLPKGGGRAEFHEVVGLGRRLLASDPAKAARVAEEAVIRARQIEIPHKVWALADAGELAYRAGNRVGGEKILREAGNLAAKLPADGRDMNAFSRGHAAARLAPVDWPAAKALLDALKDHNEFNRHLDAAADQVARTDPTRAEKVLSQFRPANDNSVFLARIHIAAWWARTDPERAVRLVGGIPNASFRFYGYIRLASLAAASDRPRAIRLIDLAVELLDSQPSDFLSWSNYGGAAGFALLAAVRGREVGHPDVAGLVARVLALRPTVRDQFDSVENRENVLVQLAAGLALVDPAAARQVLAGVAPPDKYVEKTYAKRRDWRFALALADPDRAVGMVDGVFARAKTGEDRAAGGLSSYGLAEVCITLGAADQYDDLARWVSLIREVREPE